MNKQDYIKQKIKTYYKNEFKKKEYRKRYNIKRKYDIMVRITDNLYKRIYSELKRLNIVRIFKYNDVLGCSLDEFKIHLQNKFTDIMDFVNYGLWEVDHIIPFLILILPTLKI